MQTERDAGAVGSDLQHVRSRDADRGTSIAVLRIVVWNQHAERVVPTAQVQHDEISARAALRACQIREEGRRREADGECRDAAAHELASGDGHVRRPLSPRGPSPLGLPLYTLLMPPCRAVAPSI